MASLSENFESRVEIYLTRVGRVFLAPQYNLNKSNSYGKKETSCPDFVALDFNRKRIVVVEVTTASNLKHLFTKIHNRRVEWYEPIRGKLAGASPEPWKPRFLGFVRADEIERARKKFATEEDVTFFPLEKAMCDWRYWDTRVANGLPDRTIPSSMTEHEW
ncbi:MAG TPA: hypothetical protein DDZ81_21520 [Acetobacteraceae bacterium]|nr:hypothetical protein [Acetobacteraceae bacterium]